MICQTARYRVQPDGLDESLAAIDEFTRYVAATEPGTVLYSVYRSKADPQEFLHVIHFRDDAAQHTHAGSDAVRRVQERLYPRLEAPVQFAEFELVTTNR